VLVGTKNKRIPLSLFVVINNKASNTHPHRSRDSSVGIATSYGLDSQDSIPGKGKIFLFTASRTNLGPT
jgi:hypothetical protein